MSVGKVNSEISSAELHSLALDHVWTHSGRAWSDNMAPGGMRIMVSGSGCTITDVDGKSYLDFASGLWLANVGYGRRDIAEAMAEQATKLPYTRHMWPAVPTVMLARKLAELSPGALSKVFFTSGGGEANEAALKMAVQYHRLNGEPQRINLIGRSTSYHGASFITMSVGGSKLLNRGMFAEFLSTNATLIDGPGAAGDAETISSAFERAVLDIGPDTIAAFIGEPISNSGGMHVPPDDYWPTIREICNKYGILMICDEVINGFGRTGTMFGIEHWNVVPDIMTIAKAATGGYAPLGAAIATDRVAERFKPTSAEAFQHVITFGGHAVACAAALASIDIIEREGLVDRAATLGDYLLKAISGLRHHPSVVNARGIGLMACLVIGADPAGKPALSQNEKAAFAKLVDKRLMDHGIILPCSAAKITFMPPLVVTESEIDFVISALDSVLTSVESEVGY